MENNSKPSMFQTTLTWGLITGFAGVVYSLILYFAGLITNQTASWAGYIIIISGIYLGTKAYRDQSLDGYITYGKAFGTGVMISLFYAIISAIFILILYTIIDPDLINKIMAESQEKMLEKGNITEEQLAKGMEMGRKFVLPFAIIGALFVSVIIGAIISLITSAVLKKEGDGFTRDMSSIQ